MSQGYDFGNIYGSADFSGGYLYEEGKRDAVVEAAEFGRTKDGTKGAWTIKYRVTTGPGAGTRPITMTLSVSPVKNDGAPNPFGLAQMFRHLAAMGVPVPDPDNPSAVINGRFPFWLDQNTGQPLPQGYAEVIAAQMMTGKPCQISLIQDEYDGKTRNKVSDILPARPGAPTTWPEPQAQQAQQAQPGFGAPPQAPSPYGNQAGYAQPQYGNNPPFWQGHQQAPAQPAPGGWQPPGQPGVPPQQPPQPQYGPSGFTPPAYPGGPAAYSPMAAQQGGQQPPQQAPGMNPAVPPWAQPGTPGQGGTGEFSQQGQSYQPSHMDPSQPQQGQQQLPYGQPQQQQQWQPPAGQPGPAPQMPQPPAQPPWQPPQGQPQQPGQQLPQGGPGAPPPPPWAQG